MNKKILIVVLILFILLQFVPSKKPVIEYDNPNDLLKTQVVDQKIAKLLKNACYDCHSNESNIPWYGTIAPSKWLVYHDINEAREELNFSIWNTYKKSKKANLLDDISSEIEENEMPLKKYVWLHHKAKLSKQEKEALIQWAETSLEQLYD
ncbi:MAG: heme-binding domain-containing protein [Flavobacteriales bacterium]